jgi:hypothetical protein
MGNVARKTAERIWIAYREIETGEKLLVDMEAAASRLEVDPHAPTLKDAFGRLRHLQLGVPSGVGGHHLFDVSPVLAVSVIRAHIAAKRAELAEASECARIELAEASSDGLQGRHVEPNASGGPEAPR